MAVFCLYSAESLRLLARPQMCHRLVRTSSTLSDYFAKGNGQARMPEGERPKRIRTMRHRAFTKSTVPLFFLFAKSHARLSCSLINALTTLSCRYQLFAVLGACSHCSHNRNYQHFAIMILLQKRCHRHLF